MGIGDEIMVTGEVRRLAAQRAQPALRVAVRDLRYASNAPPGKRWHRWHVAWANNPNIAAPGQPYDLIIDNAPGHRPYISGKTLRQFFWQPYGPTPGRLYLTDEERAVGAQVNGGVVINAFIKSYASPNKAWPINHWLALLKMLPEVDWVQIGDGSEPRLPGARFVSTPSIRMAFGALLNARLLVATEGALHHAAAALGVPAVVIFGSFIAPSVTGYSSQRSLFSAHHDNELGCGMRVLCSACQRVMQDTIQPADVARHIKELLQ